MLHVLHVCVSETVEGVLRQYLYFLSSEFTQSPSKFSENVLPGVTSVIVLVCFDPTVQHDDYGARALSLPYSQFRQDHTNLEFAIKPKRQE